MGWISKSEEGDLIVPHPPIPTKLVSMILITAVGTDLLISFELARAVAPTPSMRAKEVFPEELPNGGDTQANFT